MSININIYFCHSLLHACLYLPKILSQIYQLAIQGVSRMFGFNQRRSEPKISSCSIHQDNEVFLQQTNQSGTGQCDLPNTLQEDAENTLIYGTDLRETINQLKHEINITKQNFKNIFDDKIKQDQRIREVENILLDLADDSITLV